MMSLNFSRVIDGRCPALLIMRLPVARADQGGDFTGFAVTDCSAIDGGYRYYATGGTGDENFLGVCQHIFTEHGLAGRNALLGCQVEDGLTGNTFQDTAGGCQQCIFVVYINIDY